MNIPSNRPNVSVVVLTYNGSKYIEGLLRSLLDQNYPSDKYKVVVIDNASSDDTVKKIQEGFAEVGVVKLDDNLGFAGGNNEALKHVSCEYLVFVNQDTVCHINWLKGLIDALVEKPEVGVAVSSIIYKDPDEAERLDRSGKYESVFFYDLSVFGYGYYRGVNAEKAYPKIFSGCSFAIKRKVIEECGGELFDESFGMYAEDTELSLRCYNAGYKICVVRDSVIYHLHSSHKWAGIGRVNIAARAITNRVCAFFKNMSFAEIILYYPILLLGGMFKIFSLKISNWKKVLFFLPFAVFSTICMIAGVFRFPSYLSKRRDILQRRRIGRYDLLRYVICGYSQRV